MNFLKKLLKLAIQIHMFFNFLGYLSYTIDALVDTGALYSLAKLGVLPPDKQVLVENQIVLKLANGQSVTMKYESYYVPIILNPKEFIMDRIIQFSFLDGDFLVDNTFLK